VIELLRGVFYGLGLNRTRFGGFLLRSYHARKLAPLRRTSIEEVQSAPETEGITVAFNVTGGIGDHLLAARYIRDLLSAVGEFRFDVFSSRPEVATWIFSIFPQFHKCYDEYFSWHGQKYYQHYPLALTVSQFVVFQHKSVDWLALHQQNPKLVQVCEAMDRFRRARDLNEIISAHPKLDGSLGRKAVFLNLDRHNFAHGMSGISYRGHGLLIHKDPDLCHQFGLTKPYVTIHNGFDAEFQMEYGVARRSTKVYPHFDEVVALIKAARPGILIVQLGTKTSRPIPGVDVQLVNKTSLAETVSILDGSELHIDNEGGLVHLAACIDKISCVVFGPTPPEYFGYAKNINIRPTTCGGCWWSTRDWMTNCPRGFNEPICVFDIPPKIVATPILSYLAKTKPDPTDSLPSNVDIVTPPPSPDSSPAAIVQCARMRASPVEEVSTQRVVD